MRVLLLLTLTVAVVYGKVEILAAESDSRIEGEWMVIFKADTTQEARDSHMTMLAPYLAAEKDAAVFKRFSIEPSFHGYAIRASSKIMAVIASDDDAIKYVEANQEVHASAPTSQVPCSAQDGAAWGLVRTGERALNLDGIYTAEAEGAAGVNAYIIDTGIYLEHSEFGGRAEWGTDEVDTPSPETDENGHGTHVAGTVMSDAYGIAKKATAIAVKVLGRTGSGSTAGVVAGVSWAADHSKSSGRPGVGNMSLGGSFSQSMNDAVAAAVAAGLHMAIAAGNGNADACNYSPASEDSSVCVGSTDSADYRSSFSNIGSCVDIFAPGTSILSCWIGGPYATNTISGTSMAAPHVAGVIARILHAAPTTTPAAMMALLVDTATEDVVVDAGSRSPNRLLFKDCV